MTKGQLTLGLIKPNVYAHQPQVQEILRSIKSNGLEIARTKRIFWSRLEAEQFYAEHAGRFYFPRLTSCRMVKLKCTKNKTLHASTSPMLALALYGPNAIQAWRDMIGPTHVYRSQWTHPQTLRAKYGLSDTRNGFHGSDSVDNARKELGMIFEGWNLDWWIEQQEQ